MAYLIAYDIANPKRLRRAGRLLGRRAIRVQKSVYRFHGDRAALRRLVEEVRAILDERHDVLAAWRLSPRGRRTSAHCCFGPAANGPLGAVVVSRHGTLSVGSGDV